MVLNKTMSWLFGDKESSPSAAILSPYLPYEVYDEGSSLYLTEKITGFCLEFAPLTGADERTFDIIVQMLSDICPTGSFIQFNMDQSAHVGSYLNKFTSSRASAGGIFDKLSLHRTRYLSRGAVKSLSSRGSFYLRNFRGFISFSVPANKLSQEEIIAIREAIEAALSSANIFTHRTTPSELIDFVSGKFVPFGRDADNADSWDNLNNINQQIVRRDTDFEICDDRIIVTTKRDGGADTEQDFVPDSVEMRFFSPSKTPQSFAPWDVQKLIGDVFSDSLRFPCPVSHSLVIKFVDDDAAQRKIDYKFLRTRSTADSPMARFLPVVKKQAADWEHASNEVKLGRKYINIYYSLGITSVLGRGDHDERFAKSIYKAAQFDLISERKLQSTSLFSHLPMSVAGNLDIDIIKMGRYKNFLTSGAASIAPLQGEYVGRHLPHLMFTGRRGQPFFWSPFENSSGNHNLAVFGKSGSGKSVLLQELCTSLVGIGAKIIVIDDGRSFEHMARVLGGDFIEFKYKEGFSLNPFSMIDPLLASDDEDYLIDGLALLKSMVGQMAKSASKLDDVERGIIDNAVNHVWRSYQDQGNIDYIIEAMSFSEHPVALDLATSLSTFSSAGTFGKFFMGESSLKLGGSLTVFELSDLSNRPELRSVVLAAIMFLSSQALRRMDRAIPKALMIDEAWSMLGGGEMATFVSIYARTCRKYGSSLITATQSVNDYYLSDGSVAALENSEWFMVLEQKAETINDFRKLGRFEMDAYTEALLRSLHRSGTDYSEVLIKGPETLAVGRMVLDPFSATMFSSSPDVFQKVEAALHGGLDIGDAIEEVAFPSYQYLEAAE
jgi:conjugal transfer ATP-binding protein TraC